MTTQKVEILCSTIAIGSATKKGVKTHEITGHEFKGVVEDSMLTGFKSIAYGIPHILGKTRNLKAARAWVKKAQQHETIMVDSNPVI